MQKFADRDASVWSWLLRAQRKQRRGEPETDLEHFMAQMDLGETSDTKAFDPRRDDLGDWFSVRRAGYGGAQPFPNQYKHSLPSLRRIGH